MRLVSLCPSITELLFHLGCGSEVVGRTKFCIEPAPAVERVPVVGGTKDPRLPRILALSPDLVLMNEEENRREDAEALRAAGVAVHSTLPRDVPGAAAAVRSIGAAVDRAAAAKALAAEIDATWTEVRRRAAERPPVRFVYLIWRRPFMAAGPGTYVDALLSAAGGVNAAPVGTPYPEVDLAALAAEGLQRVLLASEPFPFGPAHVPEVRAALASPTPRIEPVDGRLLSWHGASTPAGLRYADQLLESQARDGERIVQGRSRG